MKLERFSVGEYRTNCYIVYNEKTKEGMVFDPGEGIDRVIKSINDNEYIIKYIFITHGHFDHTTDAMRLHRITEAPVVMCREDLPFSEDIVVNVNLHDGMKLEIPGIAVECIKTPGHTPGGFCFLLNGNTLISGDTIFKGTIGRTDLPGGNFNMLIDSIKKNIFTLDNDVVIYPGHGSRTTVGDEKTGNMFFV